MRHTLLIAALAAATTAMAEVIQVDGIYYTTDDSNNAYVTSGDDKYSGDIVIPSTVSYNEQTYTVNNIGPNAFAGCTELTSVILSDGVTNIIGGAFNGCTNLALVNMPKSLVQISSGVFYNCTELKTIISQSVTPPTLSPGAISFNSQTVCYIPAGTTEAYSSKWSKTITYIEMPAISTQEGITAEVRNCTPTEITLLLTTDTEVTVMKNDEEITPVINPDGTYTIAATTNDNISIVEYTAPIPVGIDNIDATSATQYYDLNGRPTNAKGIAVRRQGSKTVLTIRK